MVNMRIKKPCKLSEPEEEGKKHGRGDIYTLQGGGRLIPVSSIMT